jgi:hypothetical protein
MFYSVNPHSETHKRLAALLSKKIDYDLRAQAVAISFGGTAFSKAMMCLAGGIGIVRMPEKRKNWVKTSHAGCYAPGKLAKDDRKLIEELPTVSFDELNEILGYTEFTKPNPNGSGQLVRWVPVIYWYKSVFLFTVDAEDTYRPSNPDIQEITRSEYEAIVNAKKVEG